MSVQLELPMMIDEKANNRRRQRLASTPQHQYIERSSNDHMEFLDLVQMSNGYDQKKDAQFL